MLSISLHNTCISVHTIIVCLLHRSDSIIRFCFAVQPVFAFCRGQSVEYLGSLSVGETGDVTHIEHAVAAVVSQDRQAVSVALVTGEIGVQTLLRTNRKVSTLKDSNHYFSLVGKMVIIIFFFAE